MIHRSWIRARRTSSSAGRSPTATCERLAPAPAHGPPSCATLPQVSCCQAVILHQGRHGTCPRVQSVSGAPGQGAPSAETLDDVVNRGLSSPSFLRWCVRATSGLSHQGGGRATGTDKPTTFLQQERTIFPVYTYRSRRCGDTLHGRSPCPGLHSAAGVAAALPLAVPAFSGPGPVRRRAFTETVRTMRLLPRRTTTAVAGRGSPGAARR